MSESGIGKALVIGVSGATWNVLDPLLRAGRLPNIARLIDRGTSATLASVKSTGDEHYRPQVAWASLATGCHPDRHGVVRFFHEAAELREPTLWSLLAKRGLSSGIYGWPSTWPPQPIPGFIVPSHMGRDAQTWPPELGEIKAIDREQQALEREGGLLERFASAGSTLRTLLKYGVRWRTFFEAAKIAGALLFADRERARLLLRSAKLEISADIFLELCKRYKPTFASFVTFYVDFVSHRYWRYRDPEKFQYVDRRTLELYGSAVDESYFALDRLVGRLLDSVGEDCVVGIVSEHGMDPEPVSTELGPWYFTIRAGRIQQLLGFDTSIKPHPVARWVAFRPVEAEASPVLAAQLRQIEVVETARPLFRVYEHGDEVVIKFALDEAAPAQAFDQIEKLSVRIGGNVVPFSEIGRKTGRQRSAMHARDGVFVLAGPRIKQGNRLADASVLDFAPTLLKAIGIECDHAFDGKVLDIFR